MADPTTAELDVLRELFSLEGTDAELLDRLLSLRAAGWRLAPTDALRAERAEALRRMAYGLARQAVDFSGFCEGLSDVFLLSQTGLLDDDGPLIDDDMIERWLAGGED